MIILAFIDKQELGKRIERMYDFNGKETKQPAIVIREATYQEWENYFREMGGINTSILRNIYLSGRRKYFYEVATD